MISGVSPEVDGGRFPIKRVVGESVTVEVDSFTDGHDAMAGVLRYRHEADPGWMEVPLASRGNDRWQARFTVSKVGGYRYTVEVWADPFASWRRDTAAKVKAEQDVAVELLEGAALVQEVAGRASGADRKRLRGWAATLRRDGDLQARLALALGEPLAEAMARCPDRGEAARYPRELRVWVDRERARFSTWYEFFPRSASPMPGRHGTFKDAEARLPAIAKMGFDVVYLPPIHPIGRTNRKGRNNAMHAGPNDPGSPWAIGGPEGGFDAVHPQLGTLEEFRHFLAAARKLGLEVALDLAFQCSPDHPYVAAHPSWFRWRPDGMVQFAENPPKKYQDIYPLNFNSPDWRSLWEELRRVVRFWIGQGVRIFRVDNPHTKPFAFWEWLIADIQRASPDVLFLSEAFTRPKVMYELAKRGFTQSYTYFAWRNTAQELQQYFTELTQSPVREFFRPNLWPNTPDILHEYLQWGGPVPFKVRLVLAATLGANYGLYGPAYELCEHRPLEIGKEEYLDAEKYELRAWDLEAPHSLAPFIARLNRVRRENPALQQDATLRFHHVDNESLLCYSKASGENVIFVAVNLDVRSTQAGWVDLAADALGLEPGQSYQMHDLLSDAHFLWRGTRNYLELDPQVVPAHIFRLHRRIRQEHDFDYFA